jgi:hypothetical protein
VAKKLCWKTTIEYEIKLEQTGRDKFIVTYGADVSKGDYEYAARKLGGAIMHALACQSLLNNERK